MRLSSSLLLRALAVLPIAPARAGASLWVDDAAVTPAGQCQVESWWRAASRDAELTTAPACAWGSTELGLTLSRGLGNGASAFAAGIKQSLRDPGQGRWGAALSLDATWQARTSRYAGSTLNLPLSVGLDPQRRTLLHVNLGWSQPRDGAGTAHAGLGLERAAGGDWTWLAECHRERDATLAQVGARFALDTGTSIDLLAGRRSADPTQRWLTLGVNLSLPD